ncbi:hypothetical protein GCM10010365_21680 [Streptomyces poonensis]|uniref:Uncharacterized protein n=1 Tax=Streptomyces poonensis TaxID=68255 RepID=A0A918PFB2_9ACTN|nr:hypothetical protein GCM10010365_21680 [Streptomyces poonensis]GLJ93210.1 hypothetical protein GCM10017589_58220 [Streptomyces poonensis]
MHRRYGKAFRRAHELRAEARRALLLAEETARLLTGGLTGGQPSPHEMDGAGGADHT